MIDRRTVTEVGLAMLIGLLASLPAAPGPRSTDSPVAFESESGRAHVRQQEGRLLREDLAQAGEPDQDRS